MGKNNFIKIGFIILGVFIVLAIIEISIRALSGKISEFSENRKEEKKQEEIYNSDEARTERRIQEFINVFYKAVEDKDYNYVWQIINETYRKYKFNDDINNLKTYLQSEFILGDSYVVTGVGKNGGLYQVLVGISSGDKYTSRYFTIDIDEENENLFMIMFGEYYSIDEMDEVTSNEKIECRLDYYCVSPEIETYVLNIKNISEQDINITFKNTTWGGYNGRKYNGTKPDAISLKTNESKRVEVYFSRRGNEASYLLLDLDISGEETSIKLNFSEDTP